MPPPDRWTDYKALGALIPGTRLITFKVPLKKKLCETLPEKEQFTPQNLLSLVSGLGHQLGMVIDLTFTWKYYSAFEFQDQGVRHEKIFTEGHNVPNDDVVYRFFDTLESFFMEHPHEEQIVGVHCTHGINRTGYVVCRYLIERLGWDPEEAMRVYHKSRGYPIERENYIEDLQQRKLNEDYKYEGREKLPMKKPDQDRKGNKHQHNREWNHGQGSYHSHRQDMDSRQDEADNMYPSHSRLRPHRDFHHHRHDDQYRNGYPGDQYNHYRDGRNNYSDRQRYGKHRHNDYHRRNHSTNDWRHRSDGQFYSQNWGPWEHSWGHFRQGNRDDYSDDRNDYLYHHKRDRNLHRSGGSNRNQGCGQYQSRNDRSYHWHSENRSPGNRHDFDNENRSQRRSRHEVDERLRGELPVNKDKQIIEGQESEEGKR